MPDTPRSRRRQQAPGRLAEAAAGPFAERRSNVPGEPWLDGFGEAEGVDSRTHMPTPPEPTIPTLPRARRASPGAAGAGETARRRTLMAGATARQAALRPPAQNTPRSTCKVPAIPPRNPERGSDGWQAPYEHDQQHEQFGTWTDWDDWDAHDEYDYEDDGDQRGSSGARLRARSAARPLALERVSDPMMRASGRRDMPDAPLLDLTINRQESAKLAIVKRPRLDTRALVRTARSPWSMTRFALAILAICVGLWTAMSAAGEPSQPMMATWQTASGTHDARAITSLVQAETQGTRPDLYDSTAQFNDWWDAACSAAVSSEVLTAWGVPHATIGKLIDVMQPDISLNGGLLTTHGFVRGASAFGYRADISSSLTYKQMLYLTNTLGLPVIVNVRISYGYYHFFSGGHFLVVTGGDSQGLRIVDSSEYYIKYLPLATFNSMFTGITAVIVPSGYRYTLPQG